MLVIDGSQGEGGGQVLRTSVALALVTGTPFRIQRIRANRPKPGLLRQHLTAVEAAARIGQAEVRGAELGSACLEFVPHEVRPGEYQFDVGTAGSTTLVLQAVLPALLTASGPSRLTLTGGTHNPFAPPFDFFQRTFAPLLGRMGPQVEVRLERPGFYPAGGGQIVATVTPVARLRPLELLERGPVLRITARALVANLPHHIAERELRVVRNLLGLEAEALHVEEVKTARGPGNVLMIEVESQNITEVFTAFGERGVPAEAVAEKAAAEAARYLAADVPVGEHLADQLLLPFALAGGGAFRTVRLSQHARTNIGVLRSFLPCAVEVIPTGEDACTLKMSTG